MFKFLALFVLFQATIALGQAIPVEPEFVTQGGFMDLFKSWPEIGKLFAFGAAIQIGLRGLSEALLKVADMTETKWDNKVAAWASEGAWVLGVALSKVGYGVPKAVVEEAAKK